MRSSWLILAATCAAASAPAFSQSEPLPLHQQTTLPPDARFEIAQSHIAVRWTFRLDRYNGRVQQLVKTQGDGLAWEPMPIVNPPAVGAGDKPRFQIVMSGLAARYAFLLDGQTGKTWQLVKAAKGDGNLWEPFD